MKKSVELIDNKEACIWNVPGNSRALNFCLGSFPMDAPLSKRKAVYLLRHKVYTTGIFRHFLKKPVGSCQTSQRAIKIQIKSC